MSHSVEVLSFESDAEIAPPYVAISHIRSQGLGNTSSNSLFMCQLERLQKLVNMLYSDIRYPIPFWIDTACIPLTQPGKADALELLGATYRRASIVLALESAIQGTSATSALEDLETVNQSAWTRRLWTVREGALGPCVKFRFKNAAVSFDDILEQHSTMPALPVTVWTASIKDPQRTQETRTPKELALLDILWMFERDQRVYLGRAPGTRPDCSREMHKDELRALLLAAYLSTSRYRDIPSSQIEVQERIALRKLLLDVYAGHTYKDLVTRQAKNLSETFDRIETIRSVKLLDAI